MSHDFFARHFGLEDGLYHRVMRTALERGGDYCDLFFQQRTTTTIGLEDQKVDRAFRTEDLGVGIRVLSGDATGYAFCEEFEESSLHEAAKVASAIAHGGQVVAPQAIAARAHPDLYPAKIPWGSVATEQRLPLLERIDARAFAENPAVQKVRIRAMDGETRLLVVDSEGRRSYDEQPMTTIYVFCVAQRGERKEENHYAVGARAGLEFYGDELVEKLATEAVRRTLLLFEAVQPRAGEMPVVLAAGSSGILLHEAIGHGMEADFNRKGISIYSDKVNQRIAEPFVSIVDDGTIPSARGSINVDDEGNDTERTVLVEGGVLRTFLHDRISARHYGVAPTGNGRRQSFRHAPLPRMRNTYMLPGPHAPEEIIRSVERGIYAESFTNGQVKIGAGDFTFYIKSGYLIEGGQLTRPIKDVNLIGNGPQVLRDGVMVGTDLELDQGGWTCGKDGQSVPVSLGMPTVKVSAITVGGVG